MDRDCSDSGAHLAPLARRQFGLFSRTQATAAGLTRHQIDYRLRHAHWDRVDTGVYRIAGVPETWHQRLMAACLAGPAVTSHRSAAALWHLPGFDAGVVEVTAWRHRRRRSRDVVWHESYHLDRQDVAEVDGLPTTRPHRTLIDLAAILRLDELERAVDEALRRRLTSLDQIARRLEDLGVLRRGHGRMREVLLRPERLGATGSTLETRFLQLVRAHALPEPVLQHPVRRPDGTTARIDCAYPDRGIAIELEGAAFHSGRLDRQRDRARRNDLVLAGWTVLEFDWDDLTTRPGHVTTQVRDALDASLSPNNRGL